MLLTQMRQWLFDQNKHAPLQTLNPIVVTRRYWSIHSKNVALILNNYLYILVVPSSIAYQHTQNKHALVKLDI